MEFASLQKQVAVKKEHIIRHITMTKKPQCTSFSFMCFSACTFILCLISRGTPAFTYRMAEFLGRIKTEDLTSQKQHHCKVSARALHVIEV